MPSWIDMMKDGTVVKSTVSASTSIPKGGGQPEAWGEFHVVNYNGAVGQATEQYSDCPPSYTISGRIGAEGANAYLLPWGEDKICYTKVGAAQKLFFTAAMNGCGVIIAGSRNEPTIVHANCYEAANINSLEGDAKAEKRRQLYDGAITHLKGNGVIANDADLATWYPGTDYRAGKSGVFGAQRSGSWVFWGHENMGTQSKTKVIWPLDAVEDEAASGNRNKCKCCFITTAVCQSLGLEDNCDELKTLRWFRDEVMACSAQGRSDIATYYRVAPVIVTAIDRRSDAAQIYRNIAQHSIAPALAAIRAGQMQLAYELYRGMVERLLVEVDHEK